MPICTAEIEDLERGMPTGEKGGCSTWWDDDT